jgi:cellulose synthase/poly-beta-1,6-N-acetylglucosamine synthase-like glycosyltransferase
MILPTITVSELDNPDFEECLTTCLINKPTRVIIVTDTDFKAAEVNKQLLSIRKKIQGGSSSFLSGLGPTDISGVDVRVTYAGVADKRCQITHAIQYVQTHLTMFLDDHVFLPRSFLDSVVPVFENPCVGLCGTKKAVRRKHPEAHSLWGRYWELFWNVMGALYLARHNFEIRANNAMDGGVFVVSGRALVILTEIIQDDNFRKAFTNERFLFGLFGPLNPDDDNFITRWVLRHPQNYEIKIQYTDNATIETTLGQYPKFLAQCLRWARTTFRSNSCSLITDRTVWRRLPWTVWTTYIPSLFNLALFWDTGMLYAFTKTNLYSESRNPILLLLCFGGWIYLTKLVKLIPYFWRYPTDFFLFFFPIPAYPLFAYCHSILKLWAGITFWNHSWTGRNLGASPAKPFPLPVAQQQPKRTLDGNEN